MTKQDCAGCRDDYYNHNNMGLNMKDGAPACWSFDKAKALVLARDVPVDLEPPYLHIKPTKRPPCYKAPRFVRVPAEMLDAKGYWKPWR